MRRIDIIKQQVCLYFRIGFIHMEGHKRNRQYARPRHIAMYLGYKHTELSFVQLAHEFLKDHTTVMHAVKNIESLLETSEETRENVKNIENHLPWLKEGAINEMA